MIKAIIEDINQLKNVIAPSEIKLEDEESKKSLQEAITDLKDTLMAKENCLALCAPQLGIAQRIIGIKFNDSIRIFINPIVTKKLKYSIGAETCASMPNNEIFIARPEELTLVYYNESFTYEDNKLLGAAARLFDQQYQLLEGVTPDELGLISDIRTDDSIANLTPEEFEEVTEIYKQFIQAKTKAYEAEVTQDEDLKKQYKELKFTEQVISGRILVVENEEECKKFSKIRKQAATAVAKNMGDATKQFQKAQLKSFLQRKGK